ncbi:MAG: amidase [Pseudomonadales bacterium]|nr:amidase [Pseudomonadales bacterium]
MSVAYSSAKQIAAKIQKKSITSREALETFIARNDHFGPKLNAVIATDYAAARNRADEADAAIARGERWGPLHGVPMTIKDTWEVEGMTATSGAPQLQHHKPKKNAPVVEKLLSAGAIIYGKTNVPLFATDLQSFNKVYGTTNNPWDFERTPGGSSGGAAAALAAGLTPMEFGSDIGGSIRTPAHYCGVFGHKVTHGIVSMRGHIPGPPGTLSEPDLAVGGPLARTAEDLQLLLDLTASPNEDIGAGWQIKLPACKQKALKDFKVLAWFEDPLSPVDHELAQAYGGLIDKLRALGVSVDVGTPNAEPLTKYYEMYLNLLGSAIGASIQPLGRSALYWGSSVVAKLGQRLKMPPLIDNFMRGVGQSHIDWLRMNERRQRLAAKFNRTFNDYDIVLMPVVPTTAIPHQQKPELPFRHIIVNGEKRNYTENMIWISVATLLGLPATSAPIGSDSQGLPINVQIMGAPYQDKSTIKFASLLSKHTEGFKVPPGFEPKG